jgi:tetratricopeptide (TPR) repeat protein
VHEHDLDGAETAYRNAATADPRSALAWDGLGIVAFNRGQLTVAEQNFAKATSLNPDLERAHYHLALAYGQQKRLDAAVRELREALRLAPDDENAAGALAEIQRMP